MNLKYYYISPRFFLFLISTCDPIFSSASLSLVSGLQSTHLLSASLMYYFLSPFIPSLSNQDLASSSTRVSGQRVATPHKHMARWPAHGTGARTRRGGRLRRGPTLCHRPSFLRVDRQLSCGLGSQFKRLNLAGVLLRESLPLRPQSV